MKKILLLVFLLASFICAQSFSIKQITNLNADCRNFTSDFAGFDRHYFAFEAHTDSSSSIYLGLYSSPNADADTFAILQKVTDDNFMNINPKLAYGNYDSLFLIYQTNRNGNWDIAYRVSWNNQPFSSVYYFADSSADEINPVVTTAGLERSNSWPAFVSYEKRNSVYIRAMSHTNSAAFEVFHGDDTTKYTQVSQGFSSTYPTSFYIAARKVVNGKSFIVYKIYDTKNWGNENILVNSGNCRNPKIQDINWQCGLSYTEDIDGMSNIILIEKISQPIDTLRLFEYPHYNYDNLLSVRTLILTKNQDIVITTPFTYKASWNDLLFIRVNKNDLGPDQADTLIQIKVKDSNLFLNTFGITTGSNEVFYTIWEDSIAGHIQLFGRRFLYQLFGGVKDDCSPTKFTLFQNYPNPFNPSTTINYALTNAGNVKLNLYNILGSKVATIVNEYKQVGNYSVKFNGGDLASGIYFYKLEAGQFSQVRKMLLLK